MIDFPNRKTDAAGTTVRKHANFRRPGPHPNIIIRLFAHRKTFDIIFQNKPLEIPGKKNITALA